MENVDTEDIPESVPCLTENKKEKKENAEKQAEEIKTYGKQNIITKCFPSITLEPMWIGVTVSFGMAFVSFKNLFLERACTVDLGYTLEECYANNGRPFPDVELQAQKIVSSLSVPTGFIGGIITSILMIFLGPWSDNSGRRKPLIILPLLGMLGCSVALLIMQFFPNVETIWVIYAEVIPLSLGGNFSLFMMAAFSYLGDICYKTGRCPTVVMGTNSVFITLSLVVGSLLAPVLFRVVGFTGMFLISLILEITSLLYVILMVEDVNKTEKIPSIFDLTLPLQSLKCMIKKREGNKRLIVILMVLVPCSHSVSFITEGSMAYLYTRNKFGWTEVEYGVFYAFKNIVAALGNIVIVYLFKKKMGMRDEIIGLVGSISQFGATVVLLFSFQSWVVFASIIFVPLSRGAMIAERPILNRQITALEQGKICSITAILEKSMTIIIVPLSNYIYSWSLSFFPSCFLIISVLACIIQIVCYGIACRIPEETTEKEDIKKEMKQV